MDEDYKTWSNSDLIKRVTDLEAQLRAQNTRHTNPSSNPSPAPPKKKPKKASKPFDPTKYSTRHIALKFAYLGGRYNGFEYHANNTTPLPTVEEEFWKALRKTRLIFPKFRDGQSEDEVCWDGCEYSKCGRTDRGVSAFGQVIGIRVRSARPKEESTEDKTNGVEIEVNGDGDDHSSIHELNDFDEKRTPSWDPVRDELPYIQLLNRVLPTDIRILAWCPNPPPDFSARFNCKERRYRYFFTNPAYVPSPSTARAATGDAWLDVRAMREAAKKLEGLHDFRNFCKVDGSKQISNFERRIFSVGIYAVQDDQKAGAFLDHPPFVQDGAARQDGSLGAPPQLPELYYFEVRGSAFLWHQVRHMVAVLFLVGQGYEYPSVVDDLLDAKKTPARPMYDMASDIPLVLWECIFPDLSQVSTDNHAAGSNSGYVDALNWIYVGDEADAPAGPTRYATGIEDRKYGRLSIMEDLWAMWRKRKMDEVLAGSLLDVVARQGRAPAVKASPDVERLKDGEVSARVFDGSETPRTVGKYVKVMQRETIETPEVVNARYAARKGINGNRRAGGDVDMDE